jgi:hypothetical protein
MGFRETLSELEASGSITAEERRAYLRQFHKIIARRIQEALERHYDGDPSKVTAFIQTHHLPHIEENDDAGTVVVHFTPHHDDLEHLEFVIQAPEWGEDDKIS